MGQGGFGMADLGQATRALDVLRGEQLPLP